MGAGMGAGTGDSLHLPCVFKSVSSPLSSDKLLSSFTLVFRLTYRFFPAPANPTCGFARILIDLNYPELPLPVRTAFGTKSCLCVLGTHKIIHVTVSFKFDVTIRNSSYLFLFLLYLSDIDDRSHRSGITIILTLFFFFFFKH